MPQLDPSSWSVASFPLFGDTPQNKRSLVLGDITPSTLNITTKENSEKLFTLAPIKFEPDNDDLLAGMDTLTTNAAAEWEMAEEEEYDVFQFLNDDCRPDPAIGNRNRHLDGYHPNRFVSVKLLMSSESARRLSKFCVSLEESVVIGKPTRFPVCLVTLNTSELYGALHPQNSLYNSLRADHKYRFQPVFAVPREEFMFPGEEFILKTSLIEDLDTTVLFNAPVPGAFEETVGISGSLNHVARLIRFFFIRSRSTILQLVVGTRNLVDRVDRLSLCRSLRAGVDMSHTVLPGSSDAVITIPMSVSSLSDGTRWSVEPRLDALAKLCYLNLYNGTDTFGSNSYEPTGAEIEYGGMWTQHVYNYDNVENMEADSGSTEGDSDDDSNPPEFEADDYALFHTDIVLPFFNHKTRETHEGFKRLSQQYGVSHSAVAVKQGLVVGTKVRLSGSKESVERLVSTVRDSVLKR